MSDDDVFCYVAKNKRGDVYAACVDRPAWAKETAKAVNEWILEGAAVERVPLQVARDAISAYHSRQAEQGSLPFHVNEGE